MSRIREIIKTWGRFKAIITDLNSNSISYHLFQLNECSRHYQLALIIEGISLTIDLEKGTADAIDYENNYKSTGIICNANADVVVGK